MKYIIHSIPITYITTLKTCLDYYVENVLKFINVEFQADHSFNTMVKHTKVDL